MTRYHLPVLTLVVALLGGGTGHAAEPAIPGLVLAPGFVADQVHATAAGEKFSWISIAPDPHGGFLLADEKDGIWHLDPCAPGEPAARSVLTRVADLDFQGAHGLLSTPDHLYVMATPKRLGLHRAAVQRPTGFAAAESLLTLEGKGEHGLHSVVPGPDGHSLYLIAGNMTKMPAFTRSLMPSPWAEDQLLPRLWDPRGFMVGVKGPGGFILRTDLEGKEVTVVATHLRNPFDLAFDTRGELFTYDADMEWDMGAPWYRPTRIDQVVSGAEFGWHSGSGKTPSTYEDMVPPVIDVGPGSPTGLVFGTGARFPARWQHALYALDWTYGTIDAVHLRPNGAGFTAELEEFASAPGFAVTDAVVGPDGALYVTAGGRGGAGQVLRIRYAGNDSTAPQPVADPPDAVAARDLRHRLEAFHGRQDPQAVATVWPYLGHGDRLIRYAARLAIEAQPLADWRDQALQPGDPWTVITAGLALARRGTPDALPGLIASLGRLDLGTLPEAQQINVLRVLSVACSRMGRPAPADTARLLTRLDPLLPTGRAGVDAELVQLLAFLGSPTVVAKTLGLIAALPPTPVPDWTARIARNAHYGKTVGAMLASMPPAQGIRYAYALRTVAHGWTLDQRRTFFAFLAEAGRHAGGASFTGYINNLRKEALATCSVEERRALADLTGETVGPAEIIEPVAPVGPGRAWTVAEAVQVLAATPGTADPRRGRGLYQAIGCAACHRFAGNGGDVGPDLTSVGGKFAQEALLTAIIDPSRDLNDQYEALEVTTTDGATLSGRVGDDGSGGILVYPFAPGAEPTLVPKAKVASIVPSPVSPMPPGMVNGLNPEELRDLLAFLLGKGGDQPVKKVPKGR